MANHLWRDTNCGCGWALSFDWVREAGCIKGLGQYGFLKIDILTIEETISLDISKNKIR